MFYQHHCVKLEKYIKQWIWSTGNEYTVNNAMSERRVDRTGDVLNVNFPQVIFFSSLANWKKKKLTSATEMPYRIDSVTIFITCFLSWMTDKLIFFFFNECELECPGKYRLFTVCILIFWPQQFIYVFKDEQRGLEGSILKINRLQNISTFYSFTFQQLHLR